MTPSEHTQTYQATPSLDGVVAIVTGAGRGVGRAHAAALCAEGAAVVVNDLDSPDDVVGELRASGGRAVGHTGDVADWVVGRELVETAVRQFGRLDVLVNNAGGHVRSVLAPMTPFAAITERGWNTLVRGNLDAAVSPTRAAVDHWMAELAEGREVKASVISTTSGAGLFGMTGQAPYGAAKAGVAALMLICAKELAGTGIRCNAVAPIARNDATEATAAGALMAPPDDPLGFDEWDPANIAPLVVYLASPACPFTGQVFNVWGSMVGLYQGWCIPDTLDGDGRWTPSELAARLPELVGRAADRPEPAGAFSRVRDSLQAALSDP